MRGEGSAVTGPGPAQGHGPGTDVTAGTGPRPPRRPRARVRSLLAVLALVLGALAGLSGPAEAAGSLPCDIYGGAGTPCVAAHSTVRALYGAYNGPLYRVTRASDGAATDIGLLSAGGYADAGRQDTFCGGTTCRITRIYDQTPRHNDLTPGPAGPAGTAGMGADRGADAGEIAVTAGGHEVYGVWISPGVGYRYAWPPESP